MSELISKTVVVPRLATSTNDRLSREKVLIVLAFLAIVAGFVELPPTLGDTDHFTAFLGTVLPAVAASKDFWIVFQAVARVRPSCWSLPCAPST